MAGFLALLLAPVALLAQESSNEPPIPWIVPVLQVVGEGRAVPGTGVVIGEGRVLVPSEFARDDGTLVVLDGGGDLAQNGRPAKILERWSLEGLTVLSVEGLVRPLPVFSGDVLEDGSAIQLVAIAPAALLQRGEPVLRRRSAATRDAEGRVTLAADRPLPNVTGVLVDACGNWVGHSAARGLASMASGANTLYQWIPHLAETLDRNGVSLGESPCDRVFEAFSLAEPSAPEPQVPPVEAAPDPVAETPETTLPPSISQPEDPDRNRELDSPELVPAPDLPQAEAGDPPGTDATGEGASGDALPVAGKEARTSGWSWLVGIGALALGWLLWWSLWRRTPVPATVTGEIIAWLVDGDRRIAVMGLGGEVDAIIGRNAADILVEGEAVSRRHARLSGASDQLEIMDLGSTNGTFVNDRPCAPSRAVPLNHGDRLRFGDRAFVLEPADGDAP